VRSMAEERTANLGAPWPQATIGALQNRAPREGEAPDSPF
jgi:hypothetical protein